MSRRTGPGGRLRPASRPHRPAVARVEPVARLGGLALQADAVAGYDPDRARFNDLGLDDEPAQAGSMDDRDALMAREIEFNNAAAFAAAAAAVVAAVPADAGRPAEPALTPEPNHRSSGPSLIRAERRRMGPPDAPEGRAEPQTVARHPDGVPGCTSPQLRRFIKSRAYVPMHELRRRFAIEGEDDDVSPIDVQATRIYAGLPTQESRLLGDLIRNGEIGYELSIDPETPIVIGVYSMRPVSRS
jgi:hypothetical protein